MNVRIVHNGWRRSAPALAGSELRELETRAARLADLKRDLHVTMHARIHAVLVRAHECRDVDASRPATSAEIQAAREASAAMAALIEELSPAVATAVQMSVAPVAVVAATSTSALVLTAAVSTSHRNATAKSKRRAA